MRALLAEIQGALCFNETKIKRVSAFECVELFSAKAFFQSRPTGVYTCTRLKASDETTSKVFTILDEWSFHLQRLSHGVTLADNSFIWSSSELEKLKVTTDLLAATAVDQWLVGNTDDGMLSVLWYSRPDIHDYCVAVHICPLSTPLRFTSTVLVYGEGRTNAHCKHTQWIKDRVIIEQHAARIRENRGEPIDEVLLSTTISGGDKLLLEGLTTNLFVVKGDKVYTAENDVLHGSTRMLVLKACADLSIPVVLEAPKLSERDLWQAAFVTNAIRFIIDVTRILIEGTGEEENAIEATSIPSDSSGYTQKIRDHILTKRM